MTASKPNLEISTVVGCAMRCSYCPQKLHINKYAESNSPDAFHLSLEDFKTCLSTVPKNVEILFAGMAEPWLNCEATEMVLHAHHEGHRVGVYTTTVGLPPTDIPRLAAIPFLHFCIHLPDAEGRMKLRVSTAYIDGLVAAMYIPNRHFTCIGPLHPTVRALLGSTADNIKDDSPGLLSRAGNLPDRAIPRKTGPLRCSATAPGLLDHNVLLPNGDVVLCCCDYRQEHILGNLLHSNYTSLTTSEEYQRIQRGLAGDTTIDLACRRCELAIAP